MVFFSKLLHSSPLLVPRLLSRTYQRQQLSSISLLSSSRRILLTSEQTTTRLLSRSALSMTTTSPPPSSSNSNSNQGGPQQETTTTTKPLSNKAKLKQAIKDYGSTVLVFHISMSLCSLGLCYLLVSSGLDVVSLLDKLGVAESVRESSLTTGAGTFVIAYAVHKVFAPVRITITLTATPLIVKKLRGLGILKKVKDS